MNHSPFVKFRKTFPPSKFCAIRYWKPGAPRGGAGGALSPGPQLLEGPSSKNLD